MSVPLSALLVDDSDDDAALLARELRRGGYDLTSERVDTPTDMAAALDRQAWDIVLADHKMPQFDSLSALKLLREQCPDTPCVIVSGSIGEDMVVAVMRAGAYDYVMKSDIARVTPAVQRALREADDRRERRRAEEALRESEERFSLAVRGSRDGLWDWNLITNKIYYSPRFKEMLGFGEHELEGGIEDFMALLDDGDRAYVTGVFRAHLGQREPFDAEVRLRTKQGEWRWFHARGQALWDGSDSPTRIAGSLSDLTARKRTEEVLREQLEIIQTQRDAIRALSTPVIEVWEGVLTVPVLGVLDAARAAEMMMAVLKEVVERRCRHVIIDLTGVDSVDETTATQVIKLVGAVEMIGSKGIVVGIQPSVARAMVSIGADLSRITTLANLRQALVLCMNGAGAPLRGASARAALR
jgi:anti-anti-sigma factor